MSDSRGASDLPVTYAGVWDADLTYHPRRIVQHDSLLYISIGRSLGVEPGTDEAIWFPFSTALPPPYQPEWAKWVDSRTLAAGASANPVFTDAAIETTSALFGERPSWADYTSWGGLRVVKGLYAVRLVAQADAAQTSAYISSSYTAGHAGNIDELCYVTPDLIVTGLYSGTLEQTLVYSGPGYAQLDLQITAGGGAANIDTSIIITRLRDDI